MWNIPILLEVGDMEINLITDLDAFDIIRREVGTYGRYVRVYVLAVTFHPRLLFTLGGIRIGVLFDGIQANLLVFDQICRQGLRVVGFAHRWKIKQ